MYRRNSSSHPESGYILLAVLFMVALILIALAVAAPKIASDIQRDRENDLYHRGEQYKRAIKLYYKKFGRYPSSIDQLENTNNMRFLRKRYVDPMTGKDDWKLIHFGEAHVQPLGLFGQPIGGAGTAAGGSVLGGGTAAGVSVPGGGVAASGGMYAPTVGTPIAGSTSSSSSSSTDSGTSTTSGTDSSGSSASGTSGTGLGSTPGFGSSSSFGGSSSGSSFGSSSSGSSFGGSSTGSSGFGSSNSSGSSAFGSSGSSFGGAPIVGIASKSTKASIKEYKKQKHYNEWEFVYDPMEDLLSSVSLFGGGTSNVNGTSGTSPGTTTPGTSGTGFGSSSGSGFGSSGGVGSSGGFGSSGTGSGSTPTTPQQPQQ